jgi:hypothetical protein
MTGLRRTLLLIVVAVAVLAGPATAQAAFSDSITTPAVTVSTATVEAPSAVVAQSAGCDNSRSQTVRLSWVGSTTARVTGYRVTVYRTNGAVAATQLFGATATTATITFDKFATNPAQLLYAVTTVTDYGWTKESTRTGALPC